MRPSQVGRQTLQQLGSGMTSQSRHKTTSASLRTTLEFLVRVRENNTLVYVNMNFLTHNQNSLCSFLSS